jgi:hypothetical protein
VESIKRHHEVMSKVINYEYKAPTKPSKATKKPSKKASTRKGANDWKAKPSSANQGNALLQRFGLPKSFTKGLTAGQAAGVRLLGVDVKKGRLSDVTIGFADAPASRIKSLTGITKGTFITKCKALDSKGNPKGDPRTAKNQSQIGDKKTTKAQPSAPKAKSYGLTSKQETEVVDLIDRACKDGSLVTHVDDKHIIASVRDNSEAVAKALAKPITELVNKLTAKALKDAVGDYNVQKTLDDIVQFLNDKVVPHIEDVEASEGTISAKVARKRTRK